MTWSPGSASGARRSGREEVVGVGAVADGRRLLLERAARRRRSGVTAAIERPMSPPVPTSEVTEAIEPLLGDELAQVVLEPRRARRGGGRSYATWIWCIAKTIALAPQRRPSSKQAAAIASRRRAGAAELGRARRPTARRASRSASIVSTGKRASRSTSSACGAATSSAIRRTASGTPGRARRRCSCRRLPRARSSAAAIDDDALEDAALEHARRGTRRRRRPRARASR